MYSLYIHGGHDIREGTMDSLWRIDISVQTKYPLWEDIDYNKSNSPGLIAYHTTTVVQNTVYILGGSSMGVDSLRDYSLDLESFEWKIQKRNGKNVPVSIDEHTATLVDDRIYVFGGNIAGFKNNQMFVFDTKTHIWERIPTKNGPCARSSHSSVLFEQKLYIFGGKDQDTNKLNDFWEFD